MVKAKIDLSISSPDLQCFKAYIRRCLRLPARANDFAIRNVLRELGKDILDLYDLRVRSFTQQIAQKESRANRPASADEFKDSILREVQQQKSEIQKQRRELQEAREQLSELKQLNEAVLSANLHMQETLAELQIRDDRFVLH